MIDCAYCGNARELERADPEGRIERVRCPACRPLPMFRVNSKAAMHAAIRAVEKAVQELKEV